MDIGSDNGGNDIFSLLKMGRNRGYQSEAQEKAFGKKGGGSVTLFDSLIMYLKT